MQDAYSDAITYTSVYRFRLDAEKPLESLGTYGANGTEYRLDAGKFLREIASLTAEGKLSFAPRT